MDGEDLARAITDSVNSGINGEAFREQIQRDHKFLQAEAFDQVFKQGIIALAAVDYVDARNERVVYDARKIADHMGWDY